MIWKSLLEPAGPYIYTSNDIGYVFFFLSNTGKLAFIVEEKKRKKYARLSREVNFTSVTVETLGAWGEDADHLIRPFGGHKGHTCNRLPPTASECRHFFVFSRDKWLERNLPSYLTLSIEFWMKSFNFKNQASKFKVIFELQILLFYWTSD